MGSQRAPDVESHLEAKLDTDKPKDNGDGLLQVDKVSNSHREQLPSKEGTSRPVPLLADEAHPMRLR